MEGIKNVRPIYFPIRVDLREVQYGICNAFKCLRANAFMDKSNRQIISTEYDNVLYEFLGMYTESNDFEALKHVLFVVYYSLPYGSLPNLPILDTANAFWCFSEPNSWNNILDYIWRAEVSTATSADKIMECSLLLELNIKKRSFNSLQTLAALPAASGAIRCTSASSVALRIYCLDQQLLYDKAEKADFHLREETILENMKKHGSDRPRRNTRRNNTITSYSKMDMCNNEYDSDNDDDDSDDHDDGEDEDTWDDDDDDDSDF